MTSHSTFLPPSPTDLSLPATLKGSNLQIDTKDSPSDLTSGNSIWKSQSNLFSPPLSPLTPLYTDRPTQSNATRKKIPQQQQQEQQQQVLWQTNWKDVDIETLTLENAKLQRANRLLKVDREDWLEKRLKPLDQHIRELTVTNVRWQRAAKLLQQDVEEAQQQLADWKHYQITRIPQMDPEYQFLVNMIYHLQSQINGRTTSCKETNGIMTKPRSTDYASDFQGIPENGSRTASHSTCSTVSNQEMTWDELSVLVDKIHLLEQNLETTLNQLSQKNHAVEHLESEIRKKDQLMARLEKDFDDMNDQLQSWQHVIENGSNSSCSDARVAPTNTTTTTEMEMEMETATSTTTSSLDNELFTLGDSSNGTDDDDSDQVGIFELEESDHQSLLTDNAESTNDEGYQEDEFDNLTCDVPTTAKTTFVSPPLTRHLKSTTTSTAKAHRRASSSVYSTSSTTTTIACCEDDDKQHHHHHHHQQQQQQQQQHQHQRCITTYSATLSENSTNESSFSSASVSASSSISEQQAIPAIHSSSYPLATAQFTHQFPSFFTMAPNSNISLPGSYPCTTVTTSESLPTNLSVSSTATTLNSITSPSSSSSSVSSVADNEIKSIDWPGSGDNDNNNNNINEEQEGTIAVLRTLVMGHEPYAPFALMSLFLGLSTKMGINEDWLIPITLLALFSGYLWRGAFCGIRIKVNI